MSDKETKGIIFNVERMALYDGHGIRTTVFLKGCNMNCKWCHNPESINKNSELMFDSRKCIKCRSCETVCEQGVHQFKNGEHIVDRKKCIACGKCAEVCPTKAVEICGREVTVGEVIDIIIRDKIFYEVSKGGITISGGEPLVQRNFTFDLLRGAKSLGISTILDTNGNWSWDNVEEMLPYIDGFRYDLKTMDSNTHMYYTGVDNNLILENLKNLSKTGKEIFVTIPLLQGINDSDENINSITIFLTSLSKFPKVQILPYHSFYMSKLRKLGRRSTLFASPSSENIERIKNKLREEIRIYEN